MLSNKGIKPHWINNNLALGVKMYTCPYGVNETSKKVMKI